MTDYNKQTLDEARRTIELYERAELQAIPGGIGAYEIFARENGHTLVSSAVSRVVAARRILARHEDKKNAGR